MINKSKYNILYVAFLIAIIFSAYHFIFLIIGYMGNGIYFPIINDKSSFVSYDEAIMYWPKIIAIHNGVFSLADPYLYEYKNILTHVPFGAEVIVAVLLRVFDGNITFTAIFIDILSTFCLFLILVAIFKKSIQNYRYSIYLSIIFIFAFDIICSTVDNPMNLLNKFILSDDGYLSFLLRTTNLSIVIIPFTMFIYYFLAFFENKSLNLKIGYKLSISMALLAYFNFYMWTFSSLLVFSTLSIFMYLNQPKRIISYKNILKLFITYFILIIPYIYIIFLSYSQNEYNNYLIRFGQLFNDDLHIMTIIYIPLMIIFFYFYKKTKNYYYNFLIAGLFTLLIFKNIQIILGYTVQAYHWSSEAAKPFFIILILIFFYKYINFKKIFIIVALLSIFLNLYGAYNYVSKHKETYIKKDDYKKLFDYIKYNTKNDAVIASPWDLSSSIVNYSNRKTYIPHSPMTYASTQEIEKRLIEYNCISDKLDTEFLDLLEGKYPYYSIYHMKDVAGYTTIKRIWNQKITFKSPELSRNKKNELLNELIKCKNNIENFNFSYKIDYLISATNTKNSYLNKMEFIQIGDYKVYKLK